MNKNTKVRFKESVDAAKYGLEPKEKGIILEVDENNAFYSIEFFNKERNSKGIFVIPKSEICLDLPPLSKEEQDRRKPPPPEYLVNALQDSIHIEHSEKARAIKTNKRKE